MFNWWDAGSGCYLLRSNKVLGLFLVSESDEEQGKLFDCCSANVWLWTLLKAGFKMHSEGLTGKEDAVGPAGCESY